MVRLRRAVERIMAQSDACKRLSEKHRKKFEALCERPRARYAATRLEIRTELKYHCSVVQSMADRHVELACVKLPQHMDDLTMAFVDYRVAMKELQLLRERESRK